MPNNTNEGYVDYVLLGANGKPDFESLKAIDVKLFDTQISKMLKRTKVTVPTYKGVFIRPSILKESIPIFIKKSLFLGSMYSWLSILATVFLAPSVCAI